MIRLRKLRERLKAAKATTYTLQRKWKISADSCKAIASDGNMDLRTIDKLCTGLKCQPGEILEWEEDADVRQSELSDQRGTV